MVDKIYLFIYAFYAYALPMHGVLGWISHTNYNWTEDQRDVCSLYVALHWSTSWTEIRTRGNANFHQNLLWCFGSQFLRYLEINFDLRVLLMLVLEVFVKITHRRKTCSTEIAENSGNYMVHFNMIVYVGCFFIEVVTLKAFPNFTIIFSLNLNRLWFNNGLPLLNI